jgi:uncharacterized membrane protein
MTVVWLKTVHIAALIFWCSGLLVLPSLFAERGALPSGHDLWRLQRFARFAYIRIISPAAFVTVGSGIGLVFLQEVFTPWFALKLLFVGLLVLLHMRHGHVILHIFDEDRSYARWRNLVASLATLGVIATILWVVLAKPPLSYATPDWLRPGSLRSLSDMSVPMP